MFYFELGTLQPTENTHFVHDDVFGSTISWKFRNGLLATNHAVLKFNFQTVLHDRYEGLCTNRSHALAVGRSNSYRLEYELLV